MGVIIPDSMAVIDEEAFMNCWVLTDVVLPDTIQILYDNCFAGCTALKEITLPESVTSIATTAFADCKNIQVSYRGNIYDYSNIDKLYSTING